MDLSKGFLIGKPPVRDGSSKGSKESNARSGNESGDQSRRESNVSNGSHAEAARVRQAIDASFTASDVAATVPQSSGIAGDSSQSDFDLTTRQTSWASPSKRRQSAGALPEPCLLVQPAAQPKQAPGQSDAVFNRRSTWAGASAESSQQEIAAIAMGCSHSAGTKSKYNVTQVDDSCAGLIVDYVQRLRKGQKSAGLKEIMTQLAGDQCYKAGLRCARHDTVIFKLMDDVMHFMKGKDVAGWSTSPRDALLKNASQIVKFKRDAICVHAEVHRWLMMYRLFHTKAHPSSPTMEEGYGNQLDTFWKLYHHNCDDVPTDLTSMRRHNVTGTEQQDPQFWKNRAARRNCSLGSPKAARPSSAPTLRRPSSATSVNTGRCQRGLSAGALRQEVAPDPLSLPSPSASGRPKSACRSLMRIGVRPQSAQSSKANETRRRVAKNGISQHCAPELGGSPVTRLRRSKSAIAVALERESKALIDSKRKQGQAEASIFKRIATEVDVVHNAFDSRIDALGKRLQDRQEKNHSGLADENLELMGGHRNELPMFEYVDNCKTHGADAVLAESPMKRYARFCHENQCLPSPNPFVVGHTFKILAGNQSLQNRDLDAITVVAKRMPRIEEVNLEGCALLSEDALLPFMQMLVNDAPLSALLKFNLKDCTNLGLASQWLVVQILNPSQAAHQLRSLNLSNIKIGIAQQFPLCAGVSKHPSLIEVSLANTGLGFSVASQQCIGQILNNTSIKYLDLAWNCLSADAFSYVGECLSQNTHLLTLNLASCSAAKETGGITPVVYFLEHLAYNFSLTSLDISVNRIDFRGALVIEDALNHHRKLKDLDVSQNPLGIVGMRSILRLLSRDESGLLHFECDGCSYGTEFKDSAGTKVFMATNPGARYALDFTKPHHRAMLRMLYKSCERFNLNPAEAFSDLVADPKTFQHAPKGSNGLWPVPTQGKAAMTFSIERAMERAFKDLDETSFGLFLECHFNMTRIRPSFRKVAPLLGQWSLMKGHIYEQETFLAALSRDFALTYAQVSHLCRTQEMAPQVLGYLLPCLLGGVAARYLVFLQLPALRDCVVLQCQLETLLNFNVEHITGHYKLQLDNMADRAVADTLWLLDRWEASIDSRRGWVNVSQYGDGSHMRNVEHQHTPVRAVFEWQVPAQAALDLDYTSSKRPPMGADLQVLDGVTLNEVLLTLQRSGMDHTGNLKALRMVAHHFYWTALQARKLLGACGNTDDARCELFVLVYLRIVDMHNEKVFRVQFDAYGDLLQRLQQRLGYAVLFPYFQPEQWVFALDMAIYDQRVATHLLFQLCVKEYRDNLVSFRYVHADGIVDPLGGGLPRQWATWKKIPRDGSISGQYICAPDKRKVAVRKELLINYGRWVMNNVIEDNAIMWWTSISRAPDDVLTFVEFIIPRYDNLVKAFLIIDGPNGNKQLGLNEFVDGVRGNESSSGRYGNTGGLDCRRFRGASDKEEVERITKIFRYLDPGGEGEVSLDEWKVLECIRAEIWLSLHEFMQFVDRVFDGDLEVAWDRLDDDGSGEIDDVEWLDCCQRLGFFGATTPIFNFLDKDDEGTIDRLEFLALKDLPDLSVVLPDIPVT